jgi:predicted dehydrogenase
MKKNPIKIGVLGLRFGLQQMQEVVRGEDRHFVEIRAVCDNVPERLKEGCEAFGCVGYDDLDRMLAEADIEAVALFTGPACRAALIRRILRAGKHIMTTKPFEVDPEAGLAVLKEAAELGLVLHLNSPCALPGDDIRQILAWQREHNLGDLIFTNMDGWYQRREEADGSWYDDPVLCPVAPCFRLGIYCINDLMVLAGTPLEVQVLESRKLTGRPTPDIAQLSIRFEGGAIATVRNSFCPTPTRGVHGSELVFERGVVVRSYDGENHFTSPNITLKLESVASDGTRFHQEALIPANRASHAYRWDAFHSAVRGGSREGEITPETIINGIRIVTAMARAQVSRKTEIICP